MPNPSKSRLSRPEKKFRSKNISCIGRRRIHAEGLKSFFAYKDMVIFWLYLKPPATYPQTKSSGRHRRPAPLRLGGTLAGVQGLQHVDIAGVFGDNGSFGHARARGLFTGFA